MTHDVLDVFWKDGTFHMLYDYVNCGANAWDHLLIDQDNI